MSSSPLPSAEQQAIIDTVKSGRHCIVDAVAGSGKSFTVLALAEACPDKRITQITYNSQLKSEVREKVIARGLDNLDVHTYHSLVVRYYDPNGFTDAVMRRVVTTNKARLRAADVDILVIDEAQDMTPLYYRVMCKFINDMTLNNTGITLLILGDRYQGVYEFMDADTRFLTLAKRLWAHVRAGDGDANDDEGADVEANDVEEDDVEEDEDAFVHLTLRHTYRLTDSITRFVNIGLVGANRISSDKPGVPVTYLKYDIWNVRSHLCQLIQRLILERQATPGDIFVLAGSVKSAASPVRKLENDLVSCGIPCFVPVSEDSVFDEEVIKGKVIFSNFHQCKGRERPIVIIYGFDDTYFTYYARGANPLACPPTLYVAATRASRRLVIVESANADRLPFFRYSTSQLRTSREITYVESYSNRRGGAGRSRGGNAYQEALENMEEEHNTTATELTRYLNLTSVDILTPICERLFATIVEPESACAIPSKIMTAKVPAERFEEVAELNGLVIPTIFEASRSVGGITTLHKYLSVEQCVVEKEHQFLSVAIDAVAFPCTTIADYLYLGNVYTAVRDRLYFKLAQIKRGQYTWLTNAMVASCHAHMTRHLSGDGMRYEQELGDAVVDASGHMAYVHMGDYGKVVVKGRVDAIDEAVAWELKCVSYLQLEHMLQVVVYAWMWQKCMECAEGRRRFRLMNIRTGEVRELVTVDAAADLDEVMDVLFKNKFGKASKKTDEEFIDGVLAPCAALLKVC